MTITEKSWLPFYNGFETKLAEMIVNRSGNRRPTQKELEREEKWRDYRYLKRFNRAIREFFLPKLEEVPTPGLDKIGVTPYFRRAVIEEIDGSVEMELFYVDEYGLHYGESESKDPSLIMTAKEIAEAAAIARDVCSQEQE